ncbi:MULTISPECIES: phosphatase PAP2 family protein [unclassified Streptomyces]|uniref:phosphatase PAP2 family protein n=1 Tax=unclassified Streptomyces TaxID=2593676 RepID=UPI002254A87B|nr:MULTISPECIES: phosphatase PAP2 family protein [unclassified Streptomyces]MCX4524245.1 phosphatase PAP2 family protein [Streptomyces sp. NBC_01551]MCX4545235.1 phosphatase PAP2 family protein [Streptomyces sp. NBC_01565]
MPLSPDAAPTPRPPRPPRPPRAPRAPLPAAPPRHALASGVGLLVAALLIGLLLRIVDRPFFQGFDDRWAASMDGSPADAATGFATVLDRLGGPLGLVLPLMLIGCLCVYGRWRSALYVFVAAVLTSMFVVMPLKQLVDRPRPPHTWVLVNDGSYPSGQVFSAVTLMVVAAVVLFPPRARRWWWLFAAVYVGAMMWSRTWLHAQWFTDTLAGALAGAGAGLVLWRAFAPLLETEAERVASNSLWL